MVNIRFKAVSMETYHFQVWLAGNSHRSSLLNTLSLFIPSLGFPFSSFCRSASRNSTSTVLYCFDSFISSLLNTHFPPCAIYLYLVSTLPLSGRALSPSSSFITFSRLFLNLETSRSLSLHNSFTFCLTQLGFHQTVATHGFQKITWSLRFRDLCRSYCWRACSRFWGPESHSQH